jgi:hypothetical protein
METVIRADGQTFELRAASELPKPLIFNTSEQALAWLKHVAVQDSSSISRLRKYLTLDSTEILATSRLTDDATLARLAALLYARRIVVLRNFRPVAAGAPTPRVEPMAPPFPLSQRKRRDTDSNRKKTKTWISIELKDADGNAVPEEAYRIELPNGRIVEGKLDRFGSAGVDGIDPGQCKVSFPRLNAPTWALAGTKS